MIIFKSNLTIEKDSKRWSLGWTFNNKESERCSIGRKRVEVSWGERNLKVRCLLTNDDMGGPIWKKDS